MGGIDNWAIYLGQEFRGEIMDQLTSNIIEVLFSVSEGTELESKLASNSLFKSNSQIIEIIEFDEESGLYNDLDESLIDQQLVTIYQSILKREPDLKSQKFWKELLIKGEKTIEDVRNDFSRSAEAYAIRLVDCVNNGGTLSDFYQVPKFSGERRSQSRMLSDAIDSFRPSYWQRSLLVNCIEERRPLDRIYKLIQKIIKDNNEEEIEKTELIA